MKSLAGHFLVASVHLSDSNFAQSVVLMLQHEPNGALGIVLNRPGGETVAQVWQQLERSPCDCQELVHVGGPVPGPLIALHTLESSSNQQVLPGLYATVESEAIERLAQQEESPFRLFSGNAGWAGGQLDAELKAGGWLTTPAELEEVFSDHETLWRRVSGRIGLGIIAPGIDPAQVPDDPSMN